MQDFVEMFPLFLSNLRQCLSKQLPKSANIKFNENLFGGSPVVTFRQTDSRYVNGQMIGIFLCETVKDKWLRNESTTHSNNNNNNNNNNKIIIIIIIIIIKCIACLNGIVWSKDIRKERKLNIFEVWNFYSGNYLFTTDTK